MLPFDSLEELDASNVGKLHTLVFEMFGNMYESRRESLSSIDAMMDISRVMSCFCGTGDYLCKALTYKATVKTFQASTSRTDAQDYPESMDKKVKQHLELAEVVMHSLNDDNLDDVVDMLTTIQSDIMELEDVVPEYQSVGVASISVAIESTKLWSKVLRDESNPLYQMVNGKEEIEEDQLRKLQQTFPGTGINITVEVDYETIFANINYAVSSTVEQAVATVDRTINTVFVVVTGVYEMTEAAIVDTVNAVLSAAQSVVDATVNVAVTLINVSSQVVAATINAGANLADATVTAGVAIVTTTVENTLDAVTTTVEAGINIGTAIVTNTVAVAGAAADATIAVATTAIEASVNAIGATAEAVVSVAEAGVEIATDTVSTVLTAAATINERITTIAIADFRGASIGGAAMVAQVMTNPVLLFPLNWIPLIIVTTFWYSVPNSFKSAFKRSIRT